MQHVVKGAVHFQSDVFPEHAALFGELAGSQSPEVLFITCSDSRIDPSLITQTGPGDLFICRNAGNIVPPHVREGSGMTASIEYAVQALGVKHIVVCGHTDCGAMRGAMNLDGLKDFPHVCDWLAHSRAATAVVEHLHADDDDEQKLKALIEQNVILQIQHLATHPYIASRLAADEIKLHGWVYNIGTGGIDCLNSAAQAFIPLQEHYQNLSEASANSI